MNKIDALISDGLYEKVRGSILPGETYYVNAKVAKGSGEEVTREFSRIAKSIREGVPPGYRVMAWFCLSSDGRRLSGQIAMDKAEGAGQVVWSADRETPELIYRSQQTVMFPSSIEKMRSAAKPITMLRHAGGTWAAETADLVEALGYVPRLQFGSDDVIRFERLGLECAHD